MLSFGGRICSVKFETEITLRKLKINVPQGLLPVRISKCQHRVTGHMASMCATLSGKPHSPTRAVFSPLDSFYFESFGQAWADTVFLCIRPCISLTGIGLLTLDPEPTAGTCKQGTATNRGDFTLRRQGVEQGDYPGLRYQQSHGGTQRPLVGWGFMVGDSLL